MVQQVSGEAIYNVYYNATYMKRVSNVTRAFENVTCTQGNVQRGCTSYTMRNGEFFFLHVPFFTWFSFHNFAESITGTNRLIRVLTFCGFSFILIFANLLLANIKIKKGHTTPEKTWLIHLTQNSCIVWMARWLVMRFTSSLTAFQ